MKSQFDVWTFDFPGRGEHPCIIVSPEELAARAKYLNVLYCTSQRQNRTIKPHEVLLDTADGLDWESFVDCSLMWTAEAAALLRRRGHVTVERRNAIRDKLRDIFRLAARD